MSYHVTILRTRAGRRLPIERAEVESAIASRPGLVATVNGGGGLDVRIAGHGGAAPLLVWDDGELRATDPAPATLELMIELAAALGGGARVRGDDLETYRAPGDAYRHPDDADDLEEARREIRSARRGERAGTIAPFVLAFLILLIYGYCWHR